MGYFKDEHLILSGYDKDVLEKIRRKLIKKIAKCLEKEDVGYNAPRQLASQFVPPVIRLLANGEHILYVPSDGSKEGWATSNDMDDIREWLYHKVDKINAGDSLSHISIILVEQCDYNGLTVKSICD